MLLYVLLLLLLASMAWAQTTCTPGNSTFVLTSIKGPDYCRSSELAIKWSSLTVIMPADCRYTLQGVTRMDDDYRFPVSFAGQQLPYYDNSSSCISYTHMADPTGYSSGNYPSWYFDYATKYSSIPGSNLTWPDFTLSWIGNAVFMQNTGLPSINAYNTGSNRREFTPGNFTLVQTGPSAFKLTDTDLKCELSYRITSGAFLGLAPTPCKAGSDADCPSNCPAGSAKQQQQPASAGFVCALCPAEGKGSDAQSWKVGVSCSSTPAAAAAASAAKAAAGTSAGHRRKLSALTQAGSSTEKANVNTNSNSKTPQQQQQQQQQQAGGAASACGGAYKPPTGSSKPLFGSGILTVASSDLSHPVCKSNKAFAGFAAWLAKQQTWFSYQDSGVSWTVLGSSTAGSQLAKLPVWQCAGTALGGTHAEPAALTVQNQQLGPAAFVFSTFLEKSPADSNWNNSWRVLLQRTADGRIAASWFMDAENIRCAVTSVAAQQWYNAQPEAVSGTCKLFFKVAAGSVLGLSSSSACPPGTFSSQTPSGTSSCNICDKGEALLPNKDGKGSACSSCKGKSFAEGWGATSCKPCQRPYVGCERCANYECWD